MRRRSHVPCGRARGFTLVELVMAVVVLSILVAIAVPSFQGTMERSRLSSTVNEVVGALQAAKGEAIRRNRTIRLCSTGNDWTIYDGTDTDGATELKSGAIRPNVDVPPFCADFRANGLPYACDCDDPATGDLMADENLDLTAGDASRTIVINVGVIRVQ